jgi:hypothetical protein
MSAAPRAAGRGSLGSPAGDQESGNGDIRWKRTYCAGLTVKRFDFHVLRALVLGDPYSLLLSRSDADRARNLSLHNTTTLGVHALEGTVEFELGHRAAFLERVGRMPRPASHATFVM